MWWYNGRNILIKNARIFNHSISQTICTWKANLHSDHLGAHSQQDDWLARFLFLHLSSIFSTFINVELSSFYETYHKMECSLKVTVTKWIPLLLNFNSNIAQYIYFWLLKSTGWRVFLFLMHLPPWENYREGKTEGHLRRATVSWNENFALSASTWKVRLLTLWSWFLSSVLKNVLFWFVEVTPFCEGNTLKPLSVLDYFMSLEQLQPFDSCRLSLIKSKSCYINSCLASIPYQHKTIAEWS